MLFSRVISGIAIGLCLALPCHAKVVCGQFMSLLSREILAHGPDPNTPRTALSSLVANIVRLNLPSSRVEKMSKHYKSITAGLFAVWKDLTPTKFSEEAEPSDELIVKQLEQRLGERGYAVTFTTSAYLLRIANILHKWIKQYYAVDGSYILDEMNSARVLLPSDLEFVPDHDQLIEFIETPTATPDRMKKLRIDFIDTVESEAMELRADFMERRIEESLKNIGVDLDQFSNILEAWIRREIGEKNHKHGEHDVQDLAIKPDTESLLHDLTPLVYKDYRSEFAEWFRGLQPLGQVSVHRNVGNVLKNPHNQSRAFKLFHKVNGVSFMEIRITSIDRYRLVGRIEGGRVVIYSFGLRRDWSKVFSTAQDRYRRAQQPSIAK